MDLQLLLAELRMMDRGWTEEIDDPFNVECIYPDCDQGMIGDIAEAVVWRNVLGEIRTSHHVCWRKHFGKEPAYDTQSAPLKVSLSRSSES